MNVNDSLFFSGNKERWNIFQAIYRMHCEHLTVKQFYRFQRKRIFIHFSTCVESRKPIHSSSPYFHSLCIERDKFNEFSKVLFWFHCKIKLKLNRIHLNLLDSCLSCPYYNLSSIWTTTTAKMMVKHFRGSKNQAPKMWNYQVNGKNVMSQNNGNKMWKRT